MLDTGGTLQNVEVVHVMLASSVERAHAGTAGVLVTRWQWREKWHSAAPLFLEKSPKDAWPSSAHSEISN